MADSNGIPLGKLVNSTGTPEEALQTPAMDVARLIKAYTGSEAEKRVQELVDAGEMLRFTRDQAIRFINPDHDRKISRLHDLMREIAATTERLQNDPAGMAKLTPIQHQYVTAMADAAEELSDCSVAGRDTARKNMSSLILPMEPPSNASTATDQKTPHTIVGGSRQPPVQQGTVVNNNDPRHDQIMGLLNTILVRMDRLESAKSASSPQPQLSQQPPQQQPPPGPLNRSTPWPQPQLSQQPPQQQPPPGPLNRSTPRPHLPQQFPGSPRSHHPHFQNSGQPLFIGNYQQGQSPFIGNYQQGQSSFIGNYQQGQSPFIGNYQQGQSPFIGNYQQGQSPFIGNYQQGYGHYSLGQNQGQNPFKRMRIDDGGHYGSSDGGAMSVNYGHGYGGANVHQSGYQTSVGGGYPGGGQDYFPGGPGPGPDGEHHEQFESNVTNVDGNQVTAEPERSPSLRLPSPP